MPQDENRLFNACKVTTNKRLEISAASTQSRNAAGASDDRDSASARPDAEQIRRIFANNDFVKGSNVNNSRSVKHKFVENPHLIRLTV